MSGSGYIGQSRSLVEGVGRGDIKLAYGTHVNVTASDTVVTGLSFVLAVVASLVDPPAASADVALVAATAGNQAGTPAAGSILIKSYELDSTVATTFGESIGWIAIGY